VTRRHLALISDQDRLTGKGPIDFERLIRGIEPHSNDHVGVLAICATLAQRAIASCTAPSCQTELMRSLTALRRHLRHTASERKSQLKGLNLERAACFQAAPMVEESTLKALQNPQAKLRSTSHQETPLDAHAEHIVERYIRLAAHFACAALCHALDAAEDPAMALNVLEDVRGARAYQLTGLGAARQPALRAAAFDQATWEHSRLSKAPHNATGGAQSSLALQVYHEYLGGRYRDYIESERLSQEHFIQWALAGRKR
jgi:hypothetical protein